MLRATIAVCEVLPPTSVMNPVAAPRLPACPPARCRSPRVRADLRQPRPGAGAAEAEKEQSALHRPQQRDDLFEIGLLLRAGTVFHFVERRAST